MSRLSLLIGLLSSFTLLGQYQYQRLNHILNLGTTAPLYSKSVDAHSSVRPIDRWELDSLIDENSFQDLGFGYKRWLWRKLFQEHLVDVKGHNFWFTVDPVVNFQLGADGGNTRYVNTRGFALEGRLGQKVSFQSSYLENQAEFPDYISQFAQYRNVIPGQGFQRPFGNTGFDFGMASGEVTFTPDEIFSITAGQGRNFFGEGYRSMFLSDAAFNYPFLRIETTFWKIKYTNLWAQLYDIRPEAQRSTDGSYAKKYLSSHYLSININPRWNLSFFEAIVTGDTAQQSGIDASFFNPIIFYRPIEFSVGSSTGNAHLGIASSYKLADGFQLYGQFILDEFILNRLLDGDGFWANKFGWQLGLKYYNFAGIEGLFGRVEYNGARPYTYSHRNALTNYGHYGQPLAHPWGANFHEGLLQVVYQKKRWELEVRAHFGLMGLDTNNSDWGGDIYIPSGNRQRQLGNEVAQGVQANYSFVFVRAAWLVNPASGLKLEIGAQLRNLDSSIDMQTSPFRASNSSYFFVGLRTEFFNTYYDF